jgi:hypothetical protein
VALATAASVAAASVAAASVAVAFAAAGDSYNEPVYQGSAGYRRGESRSASPFFKNWGIKVGLRRLY